MNDVKRAELILSFVDRYNWKYMSGERGDFALSPDDGGLKRVFLADIKVRKYGLTLLGVIGLMQKSQGTICQNNLELSAYITNFEKLANPPLLNDQQTVDNWVDKIVECVEFMPKNAEETKRQLSKGIIGQFSSQVFIDSSPNWKEFFEFFNVSN